MKPKMNETAKKIQAINAFTEKRKVRDEFSHFVTETSFTPLLVIYNSTSTVKRVVWILMVLGFFAYTGVQCYYLLDKYYSWPMEVKLELKAVKELEFPSVTICNLNPIRRSQINQIDGLNQFANPDQTDYLFKEVTNSFTFSETCTNTSFKCPNGKCINYTDICDHINNCGNNDDEKNCSSISCPASYFKCPTGRCIFESWLCDGHQDCDHGDDEYPNNIHCSSPKESTQVGTTQSTYQKTFNSTNTSESLSSNVLGSGVTTSSSSNYSSTYVNTSSAGTVNITSFPQPASGRRKRGARSSQQYINSRPPIPPMVKRILKYMKYYLESNKERQPAEDDHFKKYLDFVSHNRAPQQIKHKRNIRSAVDNVKDRTSNALNWTNIFSNCSFNKWDALNQSTNASSDFYKQNDIEYLATITYAFATAQLDQKIVEKTGHRKQDLIASCRFGGKLCSPMNFTFFHNNKYGNCYTFNHLSQNTKLSSVFTSPSYGLMLELFVDQDQYVSALAPEAGIRVVVHKKGTMPFPEDEGIDVMPGRSISIGIKQVYYERLPPPHGVCADTPLTTDYYFKYKGTAWTKLSCLKSCYQDVIVDMCNCALPNFYIPQNVTLCNMSDTIIENCVSNVSKADPERFQQCDVLCPQPCNETRYELSMSQALWPSNQYESYLLQKLQQTNSLYLRVHNTKDEFTKLQIYYEDLIYQQIQQQKGYESMNLISDLGGQLGLWLGLSAITIGEFFSFLFTVCRSISFFGTRSKAKTSHMTPVVPIAPATLEEMYQDICPEMIKYDPPEVNYPIKNRVVPTYEM